MSPPTKRSMLVGLSACLLLSIPSATTVQAQEISLETTREIDALFAEWDRFDSPGAAVAVLRAGEIIYERGYGLADLETRSPITRTTIFHVASVSKQFTDLAVVLLDQDGKLDLDDDIHRHVPEVGKFDLPVTLRQLGHHTSGIRDQWQLLAISGTRLDDVIETRHILNLAARQRELNFPPGTEHLYSNMGFTLLAETVARVSGKPFKQFCHERIFRPLGMTHTHFHDDHRHLEVRPGTLAGLRAGICGSWCGQVREPY